MSSSSSSDTVTQAPKLIVLKVPVDCEGCRKKVTKIVNSVNGVESCEVDIKQQKVVVTGDVDVVELLKTLVKKTGKHAELWKEDRNIRKIKKKKAMAAAAAAVVKDGDGEAKELRSDHENRAEEHRVSNSEEQGKVDSEIGQREEVKAEIGMDAPPCVEEVKVEKVNKKKTKGQNGKEKIHIRVESPPLDHKDKNNPPPQINNIPPRQHSQVNDQTSSTPPLPNHISPRHPISPTSLQPNYNIPPRHHSGVNGQTSPTPLPNHISPRHQTQPTSPPANNTTATPKAPTSARCSDASYYHPHPQPQPVYTVSYSAAPRSHTGQTAVQHPGILDPPRHSVPRPSYIYQQPQQPVYTMSYNVAQQPQTSVAIYGYQSSVSYNPRPYRSYEDDVDYDGYGYRQQQNQHESFGMFSDENPNACSIA